MISSPLEQFELIPLIPLSLGSLDISFTHSSLFMCIGLIAFLSLFRMILINHHFTREHHFGFEAAAWYWHFVDVVWLFLFVAIYWWGGA
jgi:heme/copper-type cytochrome/quinol oxidase subunit 3